MRYSGFVLPLVLAVLIAISISSLQIYSAQKQYFENYSTTKEKITKRVEDHLSIRLNGQS